MPKGIFGLRANSKKEEAAYEYAKVESPRGIEMRLGSRQMNVLHEVHEKGYPVYNFSTNTGWGKKKAWTKFCMVDVPKPKPFAQCIKTDENGVATITHVDMVALGLPVTHLNLVEIALLPCTLFRAAQHLNLTLTNGLHGTPCHAWARERLLSVAHEYGIPEEHWNATNTIPLKEMGLEPDKAFTTVGSRHYGIRVSSYD